MHMSVKRLSFNIYHETAVTKQLSRNSYHSSCAPIDCCKWTI